MQVGTVFILPAWADSQQATRMIPIGLNGIPLNTLGSTGWCHLMHTSLVPMSLPTVLRHHV